MTVRLVIQAVLLSDTGVYVCQGDKTISNITEPKTAETRITVRSKDYILFIVKFIINVCLIFVCLMVFNTTFNNISVISWHSALLVEETGENH